jgi:thiamine-phosphate pyrophosphorylase
MRPGRPVAQPQDVSPRIYLITPRMPQPAAFIDGLIAALDAADVAAVLARFEEADDATLLAGIEALRPAVQQRGVALLTEGRPDLAVQASADGAHMNGPAALTAAIARLQPERMVGAGGLATRHDAMLAGEAGADYVMFGEPDAAGRRPHLDAVVERVAWWAELFEVPCVGFAASLDEVPRLVGAKADFIAVCDLIWRSDGARAMRAVAERLSALEPAR